MNITYKIQGWVPIVFIILLVVKIGNIINIPWWLVFLPWIYCGISALILIIFFISNSCTSIKPYKFRK